MFDDRLITGVSVFVAVAEQGSYATAARVVGLSRSGVGKAVLRLEDRLGFRLLDRTRRAVRLTEAGRQFYAEVTPVLAALEGAADRLRTPDAQLRGRLRVSTDAAFGTFLLLPRLAGFIDSHPRLTTEVAIRDRLDGDLVAEGYDLAVRFGEPASGAGDRKLLFRSRVLTCASPAYVTAHGCPTTPSDLREPGHHLIGLTDPLTGHPYRWTFTSETDEVREVSPGGRIVVNDAPALMAALVAGLGVGRPLEFMVADALAAGILVELLPEWNQRHWPLYAWTRGRSPPASTEAFLRFCKSLAPMAGDKQADDR